MKSFRQKNPGIPMERHNTAAWAAREQRREPSHMSIPGEDAVQNAKEHADENQK